MKRHHLTLLCVLCVLCVLCGKSFSSPITTYAGTGQPGFSGDGAPATAAQLNNPYGLARGPDGALYVCEIGNHRIRRIAPDGTISTAAGSGRKGYSGDGGPAPAADLNEPYEIRFHPKTGDMYFVEMKNNLIRRVSANDRTISTYAGTGKAGFSGDNGPATAATFNQPHSIQFDRDGSHLYVCDIANHRIRRIDTATGVITTFAGTGQKKPTPDGAPIAGTPLNGPRALDFDAEGNLYLALREGNAIYKLDLKTHTIHHVAGTGAKGFTGNGGPAKSATLSGPKGLSIAPDGNVYFADTESHSIRVINPKTGRIDVVAGTGEKGDGPDGDPLKCRLNRPHGIFADKDGALFIGDSENHRVRTLHPAAH